MRRNALLSVIAAITAVGALGSVFVTDSYFRQCARTLQDVLPQLENCGDIHCATGVLKSAGLAVSDAPAKSTSGRLEVNYYLTHRGPEWLVIHFEHGLITRMEFVALQRILGELILCFDVRYLHERHKALRETFGLGAAVEDR
jgi:hypothetical protein